MVDSYYAHELGCWADVTYNYTQGCIFGIVNSGDYDVEVRRLSVLPLMSGWDQVICMQPQQLYRISALTSGTDLAPIKHDTAAASLPSQVLARVHGTITTAGISRQMGVRWGQRVAGSGTSAPFGDGRVVGRTGSAQSFYGTTDQYMVLREGEGFAWVQDAAPSPRTQEGLFIVRNASTGATYTWRVPDTPVAEQDVMFALFNGSGSGVVLEVLHIDAIDMGMQFIWNQLPWSTESPNFNVPGFRVVRCTDIADGTTVSPTKLDTASPSLPGTVTLVRGGRAVFRDGSMLRAQQYIESGIVPTYGSQKLIDQQNVGFSRGFPRDSQETWAPGSTTFPRRMEGVARDVLRTRSSQARTGYLLKKGEALALMHWYRNYDGDGIIFNTVSYSDSANTGAKYNVDMEFTVATAAGGPSLTQAAADASQRLG